VDQPVYDRSNTALARERIVLRALGLLVSAATILIGVGLFAHTRWIDAPGSDAAGIVARLSEAGPRFGEALALTVLWVCLVLATTSGCLAILRRPWRPAIHFGIGAGFAAMAFSIAGWLSYALLP
jgi:dipeptide/tripeptide permease